MYYKIRKKIENATGVPLEVFPYDCVHIRVSDARTDEPKNRLLVQRVTENNTAIVTGIPRVVEAISDFMESVTPLELFTYHGNKMIRQRLSPADRESIDETITFDFVLIDPESFRPAKPRYEVVALRKKDIPPGQFDLRIAERRPSETDDFIWAFACYHSYPYVTETELAQFGLFCASIAVIIWEDGEDIATIGVETEETLRRKGYGLAVVSAATQWILDQKAIAWYSTSADNIPSYKIAQRLELSNVHEYFRA